MVAQTGPGGGGGGGRGGGHGGDGPGIQCALFGGGNTALLKWPPLKKLVFCALTARC